MLSLFVPQLGSPLRSRINPGSAIVADKNNCDGNGHVRVYFEGNQFSAVNIVNYADRALIAALRCRDRAATIACAVVSPGDLIEIGYWDEERGRALIDSEQRHELDYWLRYQVRDDELRSTASQFVN